MLSLQERELDAAKKNFVQSVNDFGPLQFIKERPIASVGIAAAAGVLAGFMRLPKLKTLLLSPPVLGLIAKRLKK